MSEIQQRRKIRDGRIRVGEHGIEQRQQAFGEVLGATAFAKHRRQMFETGGARKFQPRAPQVGRDMSVAVQLESQVQEAARCRRDQQITGRDRLTRLPVETGRRNHTVGARGKTHGDGGAGW
jgi:hypothetical protein